MLARNPRATLPYRPSAVAERRHRRRVCIRASTIVAAGGGPDVLARRAGRRVPARVGRRLGARARVPDPARAHRLPAGLETRRSARRMRTSSSPTWLSSPASSRRWRRRHATGSAGCGPGCPPGSRSALFLAWVCAATIYPLRGSDPYPWHDHVVTTGKYVEYALLAPAAVLLVRRADDLMLLLLVAVASSVVASTLAVVQFFGWRIAGGWPAGYRQPSFLGHHDFAALSGVGARDRAGRDRAARRGGSTGGSRSAPASRARRACSSRARSPARSGCSPPASSPPSSPAARRAGSSRSSASRWRCFGGVVLFRGGDVKSFLHFVGIGKKQEQLGVESYVQRTMLVYYGWRVFLDHPARRRGLAGDERPVRVRAAAAARCTGSSRTRPTQGVPLARPPLRRPERVRPGALRPRRRRARCSSSARS